jgi:hypothetical protein
MEVIIMSLYARNRFHNLLVVSKDEKKGTFVGEDLRLKMTRYNLKIKDYYFYDFC